MDLSVRQAEPDDAAMVLALVRDMLSDGPIDVPLAPDEFDFTEAQEREALADYAASDNSAFFVAFDGENPVGQLTLKGGPIPAMQHVSTLGMGVFDLQPMLSSARDWRSWASRGEIDHDQNEFGNSRSTL